MTIPIKCKEHTLPRLIPDVFALTLKSVCSYFETNQFQLEVSKDKDTKVPELLLCADSNNTDVDKLRKEMHSNRWIRWGLDIHMLSTSVEHLVNLNQIVVKFQFPLESSVDGP